MTLSLYEVNQAAEAAIRRFGVTSVAVATIDNDEAIPAFKKVWGGIGDSIPPDFDGRDALMLGVLLRDAQRFLGRLQSRLGSEASFVDSIVEGILFTVDAVRADAAA